MRICDWSSDVCSSDLHHALTSLEWIAICMVSIAVFEVVLSGLRTHVFSHTTSKIDVELGARLFRHILALPLSYFESRRVGDTIARVRELENIRNFLTGQALTSVLDLLFTVVFLAVMVYYRSEEHTSELQSLMRISYAVFCLK